MLLIVVFGLLCGGSFSLYMGKDKNAADMFPYALFAGGCFMIAALIITEELCK